jgi:hypothetical protein
MNQFAKRMNDCYSLPSSLGESSGVELVFIFVGEDVGDKVISRRDDIRKKSA